jgi:hypothetical protein
VNTEVLTQAMKGCGLRFLGFRRGTGIPPYVAGMVTSCRPDEGSRDRTGGLSNCWATGTSWVQAVRPVSGLPPSPTLSVCGPSGTRPV